MDLYEKFCDSLDKACYDFDTIIESSYERFCNAVDKAIDRATNTSITFTKVMRRCLKFSKNPFTETPFFIMEQTIQNTQANLYYKVIKKPDVWKKDCYFIGQIGFCKRTDRERGACLKFSGGETVWFSFDCIEAAPNPTENQTPITEDTARVFAKYKIIKPPKDIPAKDGEKLIGKVGVCKWINPWGIGLRLADGEAVVVQWDCLELVNDSDFPDRVTASGMVIGREYTMINLPPGYRPTPSGGLLKYLGSRGVCKGVNYRTGARMAFGKDEIIVPFECLQDDPKPIDAVLLKLILQNPEKILRIIKNLGKLTNLPPVQDFLEKGILPDVKMIPILRPKNQDSIQAKPEQHSTALMLASPTLKLAPVVDLTNVINEAPPSIPMTDDIIDVETLQVVFVEKEKKAVATEEPSTKDEMGRQIIQID
jgi:hypothetical protein